VGWPECRKWGAMAPEGDGVLGRGALASKAVTRLGASPGVKMSVMVEVPLSDPARPLVTLDRGRYPGNEDVVVQQVKDNVQRATPEDGDARGPAARRCLASIPL